MGDITLVGAGHLVLAAALSFDILLHKERPVSAVLWLGVVWALPYLGALGYLSFGVERVRRGARVRDAARRLLARRALEDPEFGGRLSGGAGRSDAALTESPAWHIFRATEPIVRPFRVVGGNRAELLVDGDRFFPALEEAIDGAESSIHLQTFIFAADDTGRPLLDRLAERAREGIVVRLLYDRFGSTAAHLSGFFEPARRAGVHVRSISQANPLKGRFQINLRNHRKVAVVDSRVAFAGGINIADRNVSRDGRPADRDYHVRLEGPAVSDLQFQFLEDWHFATREPPESLLVAEHFPALEPVGDGQVQVVPGGPERATRGLAEAFFAALVAAERSVDIVTPYFVPDEPILQALRYAGLRGVDVRLVLPRRSNHWYTGYAARALYRDLLEAGVHIFERGPPFMHAKAMVVDGVWAMVGSANLDYRSLHLNFELNVEIVEDAFVARLTEQVEREVAESREVRLEEHRARLLPVRLLENLCRLFQPVL